MTSTMNDTDCKNHPDCCDNEFDLARQVAEPFANVLARAYLEASDEVQAVIDDMARICADKSATQEERDSALDTLTEALFPQMHKGDLGIDLEDVKLNPLDGTDANQISKQKAEEEASFATRLASVMEKKGVNQIVLAERTGVGQSAISMMLVRNCRPQQRTIKKLADALSVSPIELWPTYSG